MILCQLASIGNLHFVNKSWLIIKQLNELFKLEFFKRQCWLCCVFDTCGSRWNMTLQNKKEKNVWILETGSDQARKNDLRDNSWYVPHSTIIVSQQKQILEHLVIKAATDLTFIDGLVFTKDVIPENICTFRLGNEKRANVSSNVVVWFYPKKVSFI